MKYNGQELEPITKPQIFDQQKEMLVWDVGYNEPITANVCAIVERESLRVITNSSCFDYCAEIPQPKSKRATNLDFIEWLAKGNGIWKAKNNSSVYSYVNLCENSLDNEVGDHILIRPFGTTEWLEPTLKNMGMEE